MRRETVECMCAPWSEGHTTHIFVAIFDLVIMLVAVPAREKVLDKARGATSRDRACTCQHEHPNESPNQRLARRGGATAFSVPHTSPSLRGPAFRPRGRWDDRVNILLSHLCVLQDVDVDEESLLMFPHASQQESALF